MQRIERLRQKALAPDMCRDEFYFYFYQHYLAHEEEPILLRYANAFSYACGVITPSVSEDELIVGKSDRHLTEQMQVEWEQMQPAIREIQKDAFCGQDSHMTIDYELILQQGIAGIKRKIEAYQKDAPKEKYEFYESCRICLDAVLQLSRRYAETAERLAGKESDENRKKELLLIADICKRVPEQPAQSFYEAVQSVHFVTHCLTYAPYRMNCQQFQLGHPDRYLLPFYQKDIAEGRITREEVQLLLDCLAIQMNMNVHSGLSNGYMVGGRDAKGELVANELTVMGMQVVDDVRLVYPAVGLCWSEGMPDSYLEKACEILSHGRSHPAIFNDDIISAGLEYYGVPAEESHNYIHSTCVEITPVASSNVWVASPYLNMVQLLVDCMNQEYPDFDALLRAVFEKLDCRIKSNFEQENNSRKKRAKHTVNPLLSCFVKDCLSLGTDIEAGGARYNWIMPSFVGMANLVDSLYAVKTLVFEEGELTISAFKKILDENFSGHEELRQRIINKLPKYGNDIDEIDAYFELIQKHIVAECKKYQPLHQNGKLIPSVFCWVMHSTFGNETGATPDGRFAGFPLGDGSGPCQGREMNGPTASILSSTKWSHKEMIGGVAVNMKFGKKTFTRDSYSTMLSLIKTYLMRGGFELQINVVDKELLEDARKNPEQYQDLLVRIGGYSDYFVRISPGMQAEVIQRTTHNI